MEQWVTFEPQPDGRTRIHTWADIANAGPFPPTNFSNFIRKFIQQWYDSFCDACDQVAEGQAICG
jgi:hypothetical protein